jgi:hypothetical protein
MTAADVATEIAAVRARVLGMQARAVVTDATIKAMTSMVLNVQDAHRDEMQAIRTILDTLDMIEAASAGKEHAG